MSLGEEMLDQMRGATYGDSRCNVVHLATYGDSRCNVMHLVPWARASEGQSPGRIAHAPGAKIFFADVCEQIKSRFKLYSKCLLTMVWIY
jgi:hypothetical protein